MDNTLFLQELRDLSLEDGRAYIQLHAKELADHAAFGILLADEALRLLYSPFVSLKLAELLIFFGEHVSHLSSHALGLKAKGDALMMIAHYQASMASLDAAGEEFLSLGDEGNWARSRIGWIISTAWLGRVEESLEAVTRAREVFLRLNENYWVCIVDHNTAMIYDNIGRYQDALKLYESMLAIYPTLNDQREFSIKRSVALAEMNLAIHQAWLGNFEQAYELQQQALNSFISLEETDLIINSEVNLADFDFAQSYYGSALRRYFQARDSLMHNNIDDPPLLAKLKLWIAKCLVKLNRAQEASQLAAEAVAMERQFGVSLNTGYILREYASILVISGRFQEALAALDEALLLFEQRGIAHQSITTKLQQAELLLEMGAATEAYNHAQRIREYFESHGMVSYSVRASLVMAAALIESAEQAKIKQEQEQEAILRQQAIPLAKQIVTQARHHNLQEEVYKSHYLLGRLFAFQGDFTKATRHYGAAIAQIERILDNLAYDLSPSFLHTTWAVYEDMIALCLQQSQNERAFGYLERARSMALRQYLNKSDAFKSTEKSPGSSAKSFSQAKNAAMLRLQRELEDWQERYREYSVLLLNVDASVSVVVDREVIQAELKRCETKISELFEQLYLSQEETPLRPRTERRTNNSIKQVDIVELRQKLAPDQLLLAYFLNKGKLVIFAATAERLMTRELPAGLEQLERLLSLLNAHLQPGGWPDLQHPPQQSIRRLLNKLYDLLVAPIADLLPLQHGNLTIVPYGLLHELPFHALYNGAHFLIENYKINYLPTSSMLIHLSNRKDEQERYSKDAPDSKGPLVFGYSGNGHLQRTIDETKELAALLDGRCYLEGEATIARLIEQAPGSSLIHIATHGQARLDAPNFAYVLLADGQFNAIDAFRLDLKRCQLVTLSGCETGKALIGGGDEQLGLGRAFLAAGAFSLVMSLWPVEDNATNELMELFYEHLLLGESKVQALRAAQCQLLQRMSSNYAHPYFWAAFRLVGDTNPLIL